MGMITTRTKDRTAGPANIAKAPHLSMKLSLLFVKTPVFIRTGAVLEDHSSQTAPVSSYIQLMCLPEFINLLCHLASVQLSCQILLHACCQHASVVGRNRNVVIHKALIHLGLNAHVKIICHLKSDILECRNDCALIHQDILPGLIIY